jgi:hypothetical protein
MITKHIILSNRIHEKSLRTEKMKTLREFDYQAQSKVLDEMLQWACEHAQVKKTTGLQELQKFIIDNSHMIKVK